MNHHDDEQRSLEKNTSHTGASLPNSTPDAEGKSNQDVGLAKPHAIRRIVVGILKVTGALGGSVVVYMVGCALFAVICLSLGYLFHPSEAKSRWSAYRVESLTSAGHEANQKRDYNLAIAKFNEAIPLVNTTDLSGQMNAEMIYMGRGHSYLGLQQYDAAITDFEEALRLAKAVASSGMPLDLQGPQSDLDFARQKKAHYESGVRQPAPDNTAKPIGNAGAGQDNPFQGLQMPDQVRLLIAKTYEELKHEKADAALAALNEAVALTPDKHGRLMGNLCALRAACHLRLNNDDAALTDCEVAIQCGCTMGSAFYNRACVMAERGKYQTAIADFNRAIELDSRYAKTYHYRGLVYAKLGMQEAADRDFAKAKELDPNVEQKSRLRLEGPPSQP